MNVLKTLIVVFSLLVISLPLSAVAECNPFLDELDTITPKKDCEEYCDGWSNVRAYCRIKKSAKKIQ